MEDVLNELCGLVIGSNQKQQLKELCIRYNILLTYPELFDDEDEYCLWGISKNGVGLIGTVIMRHLCKSNKTIFHGLDELEQALQD